MSTPVSDPIVLLSKLGKMTLNVNQQANGLVRTGVSLRLVDESRQEVMGGQDHETKVRAVAHRDLLVEFWVAQGWEVRQPWMDKMAKWSDAPARSAPTPENWGPRYVPPGSSENVPQPAASGDVTAVLTARTVGRAAIPTPARIPIPATILPTVPTAAAPPAAPIPAASPAPALVAPKAAGEWSAVEGLVRQAVECRECFDRGEVRAPFITVAQPRWIPPGYLQQPFRVVVLMINPGESGETPGARLFLERMAEYRAGRMDLRTLLNFQRQTMMQWGNPHGRFASFYFDRLGLSVDQVAFANVACCGTKGNNYPGPMVDRCFRHHTLPLLRLLAPHVVIASGSKTHRCVGELTAELHGVTAVPALHYAHRGGSAVEDAEVARLRQVLAPHIGMNTR